MARFIVLLLASCAAQLAPLAAAGKFRVQFDVSVQSGDSSFVVEVDESWAPLGAARFKELVSAGFYDDTRFFRVIPGFMAQFGLSGDPKVSSEWRAKPINDEPVTQKNLPGYITFAKTGAPNSRTTQLFVNYGDNNRLDGMGFAPFGKVEGDGMKVVQDIFNIGEAPQQGRIQAEGNAYLTKEFPQLSYIKIAKIL